MTSYQRSNQNLPSRWVLAWSVQKWILWVIIECWEAFGPSTLRGCRQLRVAIIVTKNSLARADLHTMHAGQSLWTALKIGRKIACILLVCDLNRTPNCYGKPWMFLCPFFRNLHLRENLAGDCFTSTVSTVTNSVQMSLPIYVILTNKLLQPLTTTWYDSLVLSFSLLKI